LSHRALLDSSRDKQVQFGINKDGLSNPSLNESDYFRAAPGFAINQDEDNIENIDDPN